MAWRVVIAGGGFGGLYAARRLERVLPPQSAHITLVSESNFLLYTPLLPGAAAGTLEPRHVVVPLREELERTDIRLGRVTGAEPERSQLHLTTVDGRDERLGYDHLIVSLGSVPRVLPIPGLAEYGVGFKTLSEAIALRNRALLNLEVAESSDDPEERRRRLTFVFVGAGYAGVEGIAELQDYVADVIDRYPRCRLEGTRWILVEAEERIMGETPSSLAEFATHELRGRGIEIRTSTRLWTAGVKPPRWWATWGWRSGRRVEWRSTGSCACPAATTCGRSATPRRSPTPPGAALGRVPRPPSTRSGRASASPTTWRPRCGALSCVPSPTGRSVCSSTWAGTRRWPRCSG